MLKSKLSKLTDKKLSQEEFLELNLELENNLKSVLTKSIIYAQHLKLKTISYLIMKASVSENSTNDNTLVLPHATFNRLAKKILGELNEKIKISTDALKLLQNSMENILKTL